MRIFVTGGTIDKRYDELSGKLTFADTHISNMLQQARFEEKPTVTELMMKDSLDMTEADRESIATACEAATENKILITHGTDTMVLTGKAIQAKNISDKTIVLTGAMIPYSFGIKSDAQFNLGAAIASVQSLSPGIYISMNGQIFDIDNVRKNTQLGRFEKL